MGEDTRRSTHPELNDGFAELRLPRVLSSLRDLVIISHRTQR